MVLINRFKRLQAFNKSHKFTSVTIAPVVPGDFVKFVKGEEKKRRRNAHTKKIAFNIDVCHLNATAHKQDEEVGSNIRTFVLWMTGANSGGGGGAKDY